MALDKLTQITSTGINSTTPLNGISVSGIVTGGAATFDSVTIPDISTGVTPSTEIKIWPGNKSYSGSTSSIAIGGTGTLMLNTQGDLNVAIGNDAMVHNTRGDENVCIGFAAGSNITTSDKNVAVGAYSIGYWGTYTGNGNTAVGHETLLSLTTGDDNTAVGKGAGLSIEDGDDNVAIGANCLRDCYSGHGNIAIGYRAGKGIEDGSNNIIIGNNKADNDLPDDLDSTVIVSCGATERLRINSAGLVGIGTDNPGTKLHVEGSQNTLLHLESTDAFSGITMSDTGGSVVMQTASGYLRFLTGGDAGTLGTNSEERVRITSSGNVGIGTDNPTERFTVGSAVTTALFEIKPQTGAIDINVSSGDFAPHYQENFVIYKGQPGSGTEKLRISSSGNVGIGTDNPSAAYKLHVSDVGGTIALHNSTQANTIRYANNNTTAEWSAGTSRPGLTNAGDYYSITQYGTDGTWRERFTIDSAGLIKTNQNSIEFGSNGLRLVGTNDVATYGWDSKPGIYATSDQEFRMHSASGGEMDLYVDGFGYFEQGVKGAFVDADAYLQTTMAAGATYTWNPGSGIPANVWVSMNVFLSSMDSDQSDHFDVVVGPSAFSATTWGDTNAANTPPNEHSIITHMGDNQTVEGGWYGKWDHVIAKSDSNGDLIFKLNGSNGGTGLNVRIQGYWMDKDSTSVGG